MHAGHGGRYPSGQPDEPSPVAGHAPERVPWLVVLLAAGGTELLPDQRLLLRQVPMEPESVDVALATRYEDAGLSALLPRELVLEVHLLAEDTEAALATAGAVAVGVVALLSFAVNAFVPPPEPYLAYEAAPGLTRRRFWHREVELLHGVPWPRRQVNETLLFPLLAAFFRARDRLVEPGRQPVPNRTEPVDDARPAVGDGAPLHGARGAGPSG